MAKLPMLCPFSGKMCKECLLFRGRHYYLCTNKNYRGYIKSNQKVETEKHLPHFDFDSMKKSCEPWSVNGNSRQAESGIKLKVVDRENGTTRICDPAEAEKWEWHNPEIMRTFNGGQVGSFNKLMEIIQYQATKGAEEVEIMEAPWFLLA